jgi:hypothetical protein
MVRTGIEIFGIDFVREELFPIIRAAEIRVRPPNKVAISTQLIHGYKAIPGKSNSADRLEESIIYREFCHAEGVMTVHIRVPMGFEDACRQTLESVGY